VGKNKTWVLVRVRKNPTTFLPALEKKGGGESEDKGSTSARIHCAPVRRGKRKYCRGGFCPPAERKMKPFRLGMRARLGGKGKGVSTSLLPRGVRKTIRLGRSTGRTWRAFRNLEVREKGERKPRVRCLPNFCVGGGGKEKSMKRRKKGRGKRADRWGVVARTCFKKRK